MERGAARTRRLRHRARGSPRPVAETGVRAALTPSIYEVEGNAQIINKNIT